MQDENPTCDPRELCTIHGRREMQFHVRSVIEQYGGDHDRLAERLAEDPADETLERQSQRSGGKRLRAGVGRRSG